MPSLPLLLIACGSSFPPSVTCFVNVIAFVFTVWCAAVNYNHPGFTDVKTDMLVFCDFLNVINRTRPAALSWIY